MDMFCVECMALSCPRCAVFKHHSHTVQEVPAAHATLLLGVREAVAAAAVREDTTRRGMEMVRTARATAKARADEAEDAVHALAEKAICAVRAREQVLVAEVRGVESAQVKVLEAQEEVLEGHMRAAQAMREMGAQALSIRDAVAGVQAAALVIQRHQAMKTSGDINTTPEARGCISFEGTTAWIEKEIGKMGSVNDGECRVEDCVLERGEWLGNVQTFVVRAKDKKGAPARGLVLEARVVEVGGGTAAAAADDCVAVGVRDMGDGSYRMEAEDGPDTAGRKQMEVMLSGRHVQRSPMDLETEAQRAAREEQLFGKSVAEALQQMRQGETSIE